MSQKIDSKVPQGGTFEAGSPMKLDANGKQLKAAEAVALKAPASGATAKACLTLYNGPGVTWLIDITFDPNTLQITGGSIKGTICGSPWSVTGGNLLNGALVIHATRGSAAQVTILGVFQSPPSYKGTYGFDAIGTGWTHTTLYCCGACP
jgi:hypothetical protein